MAVQYVGRRSSQPSAKRTDLPGRTSLHTVRAASNTHDPCIPNEPILHHCSLMHWSGFENARPSGLDHDGVQQHDRNALLLFCRFLRGGLEGIHFILLPVRSEALLPDCQDVAHTGGGVTALVAACGCLQSADGQAK
jgi:hypothetical protein